MRKLKNKSIRKRLASIILLIYSFSYAQTPNYAPIEYPNSPDVTKMQTYGQIPVTPYSGLANVSVPVYTIKEDDFEFPISLDYNARGIKVREEATRVGLGWSLGFPGLISRSINGQDDFLGGRASLEVGSVNGNGKYFNAKANDGSLVPDFTGYAAQTNYLKLGLDTRIWPSDYKLDDYTSSNSSKISENIDFQPDDFSYRLPKYSGKFIFKRDKQPVLEKLEENLKIEILDSLNSVGQATMKKMKIIDKEGNTYTFNDFERYVYQGMYLVSIDNAWYISKIKTKNGNEIKFTYDIIETYPSYNLYDYSGMPLNLYNESGFQFPFGEQKVYEGLKWFKSKLIKKIEFSTGKLEFEYDSRNDIYNDKKIISISLRDKQDKLIKKIKLNYDYFEKNFTSILTDLGEWQQNQNGYNYRQNFLNKRLKLNSIDFLDNQNTVINTQSFDYYDQYIPAKNSTAIDLWGYFNGVSNNPHLFQDFYITVPESTGNEMMMHYTGAETTLHITGSNRDVNPLFTNAMSLKKITYPTKGSSEFIYENNTYDPSASFQYDLNASKISIFKNENSSFKYAGGLRVKTITNNDNTGGIYAKNYLYHDENNPNLSMGYLIKRPNFFDLRKKRSSGSNPSPTDINYINAYVLLRNQALYDEDFIGYKKVIEIRQDNSNTIKKVYEYNTSPTYVYSYIYSLGKGLDAPTPNFTEPQYSYIKANLKRDPFIFRSYGNPIDTNNFKFRDYSFDYKPFEIKDEVDLYNGLLKSVKDYKFENQIFKLINTEDYIYNTFYNQNQYWGVIYGQTADERIVSGSNSYFAFHNPYNIIVQPLYWPIIQTKGYVLEQYNIIYKAIKSLYNPGPLTITKNEYLDNGQTLTTKKEFLYGSINNSMSIGNPLSQKTTFVNTSETLETLYQYASEKGNTYLTGKNIISTPLETEVKKNGITISKTETKYPVSQSDADTKTAGLPLPYEAWSKDLQTSTMEKQITYDSYDNKGNILQYTTKSGVSTAIIWGYNQTQPIAKIEGATYAQVSALASAIITSSDGDSSAGANNDESAFLNALDVFRKNSVLAGLQITNYTYDPLIGVRSITLPSGIRELYYYDSANRLQSVKDKDGKILKEYQYNYKH